MTSAQDNEPADPQHEQEPDDLVGWAVKALTDRDFGKLQSWVNRAWAQGRAPDAIRRVQALGELAQGRVRSARSTLSGFGSVGQEDVRGARTDLAYAWVALHEGDAVESIRFALRALARTRKDDDTRGQEAAMRTLSAAYRALGRDDDAARLEQASCAGSG